MDEDKIFDNELIRDTVKHDSVSSDSGNLKAKTIFVENSLDKQVTLQLQGARNSVWINVGTTFDINANTNGYQTVSDYFPKFRIQASCSVPPTTGNLDVWILKV